MPLPPNRFRFSAKNIFLTYSHCSLSKEEALSQLLAISLASNKKFIRVARELHDDGQPHLHILLQLEGKVQITNQRLFDLCHVSSSLQFHPNIQIARSSSDIKAYIEKDGDYTDCGKFQIDGRSSRGGPVNLAEVYADTLKAGSVVESLQIIREKDPENFFLQYHNLRANAERLFAPPIFDFKSKWGSYSFVVSTRISQWLLDNFVVNDAARLNVNNIYTLRTNIDRPVSLILEGPSQVGKTSWARSVGLHNYICGHIDFNANVFRNDVIYNVIDDVLPQYLRLKHWKELIGA